MIVDRIWRFFCSVRAAIFEIAFLALLVLIGTLRGSDAPQWLADGIPATEPLVTRWYDWDVFRSPIFATTLAIIAVAIAVCTINRVPTIWQSIGAPTIRTTRGWLKSADASAVFASTGTTEQLTDDVSGVLKQRRYRVITEKVGNEIHLYADKNRYAKLGTFPFHLALILIMVGGLMAAHYGFRETEFIVVEGETRNVGHGTDLSIRLDKYTDDYTAMGVALQYQSSLTILDGGKEAKSGDISVNHPMNYGSATVYQSSYGYAKQFTITDRAGNVIYSGSSPMGIFYLKTNTDAPAGLIDLPTANAQVVFVGKDIAPYNQPEKDELNLTSDELWIQYSVRDASGSFATASEQKIVLNTPTQIGDYTITWTGTKPYSLMQVAYNPGVPIFLIAAVLLVGGLVITFYFPHRRLRAIVSPTPNGAMISMAPLAKRDWSGKQDFLKTLGKVREKLGPPQDLKLPKGGSEWDRYASSLQIAPENRG